MKKNLWLLLGAALLIAAPSIIGAKKGEFEAPIKKKMAAAQKLVNDAVQLFKQVSIGHACRQFEIGKKWHVDDLFISVFSEDGTCYLHGNDSILIWERVGVPNATRKGFKGEVPQNFIKEMLERGEKGGWVSYKWDYASRYSYVKTVRRRGQTFIISAGFYPDSPRFIIQQMVKAAISTGEVHGAADMFQQISNPRGPFVRGELYLWAYDMKGNVFAHGHNIAYIGQNRIDWKDSRGRFRNREMLSAAEKSGSGWIEYDEDGTEKEAYFETFTDPRTNKKYVVGGGFYPNINDDKVRTFVKRAINYLKANGPEVSFRDFTSYSGGFMEGPLRIFVYNIDYTMLADGANPSLIGQNLYNARDLEGKYIAREIIETAKRDGSGWVTFLDNDAYRSNYVEYVEIPDGKYVIGSGYWPISKEHTARALAEKASRYMQTHSITEALNAFVKQNNNAFLRGDLFIRVYSDDGLCLSNGPDVDRIWRDETKDLDEHGYPIFDKVKATATQGGGWVKYKLDRGSYKAFVKMVGQKIVTAKKGEPENESLTVPEGLTAQEVAKLKKPKREALAPRDKIYNELVGEPRILKRGVVKTKKGYLEATAGKKENLYIISVGYYA